jgi:hypothetical protein
VPATARSSSPRGQPEVEDPDPAVGAEDRVVGLEVAVDQPGGVGGGQPVAGLAVGADDRARAAVRGERAQGLAAHQLHHQEHALGLSTTS